MTKRNRYDSGYDDGWRAMLPQDPVTWILIGIFALGALAGVGGQQAFGKVDAKGNVPITELSGTAGTIILSGERSKGR